MGDRQYCRERGGVAGEHQKLNISNAFLCGENNSVEGCSKNQFFWRPFFKHPSADYEKYYAGCRRNHMHLKRLPPGILSGPRPTTSTTARFIMRVLCGIPSHWFYPSSAGGSKVRGTYYAGYYAGSIKSSEAIFYAQAPVAFLSIMRGLRETTPDRPPRSRQ